MAFFADLFIMTNSVAYGHSVSDMLEKSFPQWIFLPVSNNFHILFHNFGRFFCFLAIFI